MPIARRARAELPRQRRADILAQPVAQRHRLRRVRAPPTRAPQHVLVVTFLKPLPDPPHSDPDGAYGLTLPRTSGS